jgi:hypothetical protein
MGRLGAHPNIMQIFDLGDEDGQPYMVLPVLADGDVEGLIQAAPDHRVPLEQALEECANVCSRPEIALTRLQLAELLLDQYPAERKDALEHLDFAIA